MQHWKPLVESSQPVISLATGNMIRKSQCEEANSRDRLS